MLKFFEPFDPMLCRYWYVEKMLKREGQLGVEIKFNGIRVLVHKQGDTVKIFTRHRKDARLAVFDIVYYEGDDITGLQLYKRRELLEKIMKPNDKVFLVDQIVF